MKLVSILLILIDILVLWKLLNTKDTPTPTKAVDNVVYIQSRPRRVVPAEILAVEEVDLEELKEELRIKFLERRKAWERDFIWNNEDNLRKFRVKHGIPVEDLDHTKGIKSFEEGLFSLTAI